jgi:hypothetical protein
LLFCFTQRRKDFQEGSLRLKFTRAASFEMFCAARAMPMPDSTS